MKNNSTNNYINIEIPESSKEFLTGLQYLHWVIIIKSIFSSIIIPVNKT
ncbi:MAG: hypothetical protein H0X03_08920 [Nitrosopumilus sp.]|nr:hypothetical protein [Nitrosopumilus sp.]